MKPDLQGLIESIKGKKGKCEQCCLKSRLPLLFCPNRSVEVMVVTQGPNGPYTMEASEFEVAQIKKVTLFLMNRSMYPFLYTLFSGQFRPDGDVEGEASTAYWTHMRKCFVEGEKLSALNLCSKSYLETEIRAIRPQLILSIGGRATNFFARFKTLCCIRS